jgi:hypothetical protein
MMFKFHILHDEVEESTLRISPETLRVKSLLFRRRGSGRSGAPRVVSSDDLRSAELECRSVQTLLKPRLLELVAHYSSSQTCVESWGNHKDRMEGNTSVGAFVAPVEHSRR